ncbi:unnamed protein product [Clonostachys rhizophaga]|uniref:Uncharacterized protein n=1 Tax=Clonostachys rhizophaga TaxID=160324 RepID=A0A9N9YK55_9HYPO|nr:unnamed protein product [Clonostachys rhizophaga]
MLSRGCADDFRRWQHPKYIVAPHFDIVPPPDGPFALGKFVEDTKDYAIINENAPIPVPKSYSSVKTNIDTSVYSSRTYETETIAKVLDRSIGGNANLKGIRADSDVFHIQKLETIYFNPTKDYIQQCRALPNIDAYLKATHYQKPVYLITGLKVAWGATYSTSDGQHFDAGAGAAVTLGTEELNAEVKGEGRLAKAAELDFKANDPFNFVLGIRLLKFFHKRKHILSGEMVPCEETVTDGAVLLDASSGTDDQDDELVAEELDEQEAAMMVL